MDQFQNPLECKERDKKDFYPCINNLVCKGKWYRYKNRKDNGYCKLCVKTEIEK